MIGPQRLFSYCHLYSSLTYFFLVGAIASIIQWTLHKNLRLDVLKYLNFPIIFAGAANLPRATPLNYVPWVLVCYVFHHFVRRHYFGWWSKYSREYFLPAFREDADILTCVWVGYSVCWFGYRLWHRCRDHLLCSAIPQERHDRSELCSGMVGQHGPYQNGILSGRAIQDDWGRRNL